MSRLLATFVIYSLMYACNAAQPPAPPPIEDAQVQRLVITTTSPLPHAVIGMAYSDQLQATGGRKPYTWKIIVGTAPAGLKLSQVGLVSGKPTKSGKFSFTVQVRDSAGNLAMLEVQ